MTQCSASVLFSRSKVNSHRLLCQVYLELVPINKERMTVKNKKVNLSVDSSNYDNNESILGSRLFTIWTWNEINESGKTEKWCWAKRYEKKKTNTWIKSGFLGMATEKKINENIVWFSHCVRTYKRTCTRHNQNRAHICMEWDYEINHFMWKCVIHVDYKCVEKAGLDNACQQE